MKTKEECKNEAAKSNNFDSFEKAIRYTFNRELLQSEKDFITKIIDEAMDSYAEQANEAKTSDESVEVCKGRYKHRGNCVKYGGECAKDDCDYWQA